MWVGPPPEKKITGVYDIFCSLVPFNFQSVYLHKVQIVRLVGRSYLPLPTNIITLQKTNTSIQFQWRKWKSVYHSVFDARDPSSRPPFAEIVLLAICDRVRMLTLLKPAIALLCVLFYRFHFRFRNRPSSARRGEDGKWGVQ